MNIVMLSGRVRFPTARAQHNVLQTQKAASESNPEGGDLGQECRVLKGV